MSLVKPDGVETMRVGEAKDIGFELMDLGTGETVVSVTAAVTPTGLTVATATVDASNKVSARVSGGVAGKTYRVIFTITTTGNIFIKDYKVMVTS